jgi:ABC-type lipoprotein export system ATPase subunit
VSASEPPTVVHLHAVRKAFHAGTPIETEVLHGIDLTLQRGEFCAVMGPSGSGKSTLLNIVGLLDRPTSGQLSISGEDAQLIDGKYRDAFTAKLSTRLMILTNDGSSSTIRIFMAAPPVLLP